MENRQVNPKFLINTFTAWNEPPRARHQVASALSMRHQVVFISKNKVGLKRGIELRKESDSLTVITPVYPVDQRFRMRIPGINESYQRWLFRRLKKDFKEYKVINFDFTAHRIFNYFPLAVYYCNDECIGNTSFPNWFTDTYYKISERTIIRKSLFNVTTTPYLTRKLLRYNPRTYEIPLGANLVQEGLEFKSAINKEKITVCLMGDITEKQISLKLMNEILSNDLFQLLLIGPIEASFLKKLKSRGNLTIAGVLKGPELTQALSEIDVGLALYNIKNINPGASPNKLWQYLSVGKPSVVSYLENLRAYLFPSKSVYIHHDGDSITDLIQQALNEDSEELHKERIDYTSNNTWEKRIELLLSLFEQHDVLQ